MRAKLFEFEGQRLSVREIRERYLPAYSVDFIRAGLVAGVTTRAGMRARDLIVDPRIAAGAKRGRENARIRGYREGRL